MLATSVVMLALAAGGPYTAVGYFKAAVAEKDRAKKGELVQGGLTCLLHLKAEKDRAELDRLFTLYLGFLAADLPFEINHDIAMIAGMLPLSVETRAVAVEALDGYVAKLRGSKEDVAPPLPKDGGFTGIGHGMKPSEWIEDQYVNRLRARVARERELEKKK